MSDERSFGEPEEMALELFPFQLADVRLYELTAARSAQLEDDKPAVAVSLTPADEPIDAETFGVLLGFEACLKDEGEEAACAIDISLEGVFRSLVDLDTIKPDVIERFKTVDALVLLWPYLRELLHDLTTRMRLDWPPLPTIDARALLLGDDD